MQVVHNLKLTRTLLRQNDEASIPQLNPLGGYNYMADARPRGSQQHAPCVVQQLYASSCNVSGAYA